MPVVLARLSVPGAGDNVFSLSLIFVWFVFALASTWRSAWLRYPARLVLWSLPEMAVFRVVCPPAESVLV